VTGSGVSLFLTDSASNEGIVVLSHKHPTRRVLGQFTLLATLVFTASPGRAFAQEPAAIDSPALADVPLIDDVEAAFSRIATTGTHVMACSSGRIPKPLYRPAFTNYLFGLRNHFQGIQRLPQPGYVAISGANRHGADLFIVRVDDDANGSSECESEVIKRIEVDDELGHAGGLSMLGSILAVPLYRGSPRTAKVVFYDLADPESPRRLAVEIERPGRKATATAFTRLHDGHYLVAVLSAWDRLPRRIDFYLSRTPSFNDGFDPDPLTWNVSDVGARQGQNRSFSHFQSINFIPQADGRLYLVGFHNNVGPQAILPGRDYADLYEVDLPAAFTAPGNPAPTVTKVANRNFRCTDGFCSFGAAAGVFVDPATKAMTVYAAPGWLDDDKLKMTVYPTLSEESSTPQ
jgi:hypothetical protein